MKEVNSLSKKTPNVAEYMDAFLLISAGGWGINPTKSGDGTCYWKGDLGDSMIDFRRDFDCYAQ